MVGGVAGIVAHRGASGEFPEHTMSAFEAAVTEGADAIECDVRLTKDQHLVCLHDRTVERTSDGTGAVSELDLADLKTMDFGSWKRPGHPEPVVTLDELIELARTFGRKLFVETKHPVRFGGMVEQKLLAALQRHGLTKPDDLADAPVVVISFSGSAIWRVRRNAPGVPAVLLGEASRLLGGSGHRGPRAGHRAVGGLAARAARYRRQGPGRGPVHLLLDRRFRGRRGPVQRPRRRVDRHQPPGPYAVLAAGIGFPHG